MIALLAESDRGRVRTPYRDENEQFHCSGTAILGPRLTITRVAQRPITKAFGFLGK